MLTKVRYSCDLCGLIDRECIVPSRTKGQPVEDYINIIADCIKLDHAVISKHCNATVISKLKIPVEGEGWEK